ncbi:MAG: DNA polymerase III subunit delta [Oscillospiraceae bacterium]|nr:DNA polymerase III subunit delta [Oscillospiraceae bacterium]
MPQMSVTELNKKLKGKNYSSLYYFYGKDVMSVELYTKTLVKKLVSDDEAVYNFHKFNGKDIDLSEFAETVEALPMFAEYMCITVNDLNAEDLATDDINFLMKILKDIPETTVVIFYNTAIDVCGGKKSLTAKNKKIVDCIAKTGDVCEFAIKTPLELSKQIVASIEKKGSSISSTNAAYIAELCLSDNMLISGEIDKLTSYAKGREITKDDIDSLVSRQVNSSAFDLSKAVVSFNKKKALLLLDELFYQRAEPIAVLSAISMSFMDLYRASLAVVRGIYPADVVTDFSYKANRKFAVDYAFRDCRKINIKHLRKCIKILADTDSALKSSKTDGRILLEKAIVQMVSEKD